MKRKKRNQFEMTIILIVVAIIVIGLASAVGYTVRSRTVVIDSMDNIEAKMVMESENAAQEELIIEIESTEDIVQEPEIYYLPSLKGQKVGREIDKSEIDITRLEDYFMVCKIDEGDNIYTRINGKSYQKNDHVPLSSLRYIKLLHYNFEGQIQVGEIIVNEDVTQEVVAIFMELFREEYQIYSMYLIDDFWTGNAATSDSASIDKNNTSAFCYRKVTGGKSLSNHAYGRAIDINPQQNPYVSNVASSAVWAHSNASDYIYNRDRGQAHVITHDDLAYKVFAKYGFSWGGNWNEPKDYQHFEKKR